MPSTGQTRAEQRSGGAPPTTPRHLYVQPAPEGSLGARIREERMKRNWTQTYLGELIDVAQAQISAWERGEIKVPLPASLVRMAEAFEIEPRELLDLTPWAGSSRHLASVPPPGSIIISGERVRPLLVEVIDLVCDLDDAELDSVLHRIDHLLERRLTTAPAPHHADASATELVEVLRAASA